MAEAVLPLWLVRAYEEGERRALATAAVREEQQRHQALKRAALLLKRLLAGGSRLCGCIWGGTS